MRPPCTPIAGGRSTLSYGVPSSNGPPNVQLDMYGHPIMSAHRRSSENMVPPNVTVAKSSGSAPMM